MDTAKCKSCKAPIIWLKTALNKAMPVDAGTVREGDTIFLKDVHTSHFATCPDAAEHRKPKTQRSLFGDEE